MSSQGRWYFSLFAAIVALSLAFFVLPLSGSAVYLSPDETAVSVAAKFFSAQGTFKLTQTHPFIWYFPWLHPRSFVSLPEATGALVSLVPVGFLGMPLLAAAFEGLAPHASVFITPFLAISAIFPLWSFTRRWGFGTQAAAVLTWLTFPTVILYANRGLFPNLPVVCLALWAMWCASKYRRDLPQTLIAAGLLSGLALAIRPPEALWLLPWVGAALWLSRKTKLDMRELLRAHLLFALPLVAIAAVFSFLAWKTYGHPFAIGYALRDPVMQIEALSNSVAAPSIAAPTPAMRLALPFGFHPRNMLFNLREYLAIFLFPWFAVMIVAAILALRNRRAWPGVALGMWTLGVLALLYGQGIYQDHVRQNYISLANSFLRYILPVSVFAALAMAYLTHWLILRWPKIGKCIAAVCVAILMGLGLWSAFARDNEGLLASRYELVRYQAIRERARSELPVGTVVLSERSDKIFFPAFHAVSPLPSRQSIAALLESLPQTQDAEQPSSAALFIRTVSREEHERWKADGVILKPLFTSGNESLYFAYKMP